MGAVSVGTLSAYSRVPKVVRMPLVTTRSLVENGTPCSGPSLAPRFVSARSAPRADRIACSAVRVTKALSVGFRRSIRASTAFMTSTGETFFRRMAAAISEAGIQHSSSGAMYVSLLPLRVGSGAAEARVQGVAERVTKEIRAEHCQADGNAREEHEVRRLLCVFGRRDRQHAPPRGIRLGNAEPEEGQRRLDQDGAPELGGAEHDEGPHRIGQDVTERDTQMREAERARRL